MRSSSYVIAVPLPDTEMTLLFHGYSGAVDLVTSRIADLLTKSDRPKGSVEKAFSQDTLTHLTTRGYLTDKSPEAEEAYVEELGRRVHAVMRKYATPGFLVVPTYACNLRCTYCYERSLRQNRTSWLERRMSAEMVGAALDAMDRLHRPSRRPRCLTFYGGEPLQKSNEQTIRLLHEESCKRGFQRFSAITNAVDLHHYQDMLGQEKKISFLQITVDGPPSVHDKRRFLPDGSGTFRRVIKNIELAMNYGTTVSVRINVDRGNADRVGWLRDFFRDKGWTQNALFRAYCSPIHESVCSTRSRNDFTSHLEMRQAIRGKGDIGERHEDPSFFQTDALTHSVRKRILSHLSQKEDLPFWKTAFCGSNMAMYLFDPFGDIYPCWEVIGHPEHRIGAYGPDFLELDQRALEQWHQRSVVRIPSCRSCPYLFFCGGGCEAFAYRTTGSLDQPHCFDFPKHFQKAALLAYADWNALPQQKKSTVQ